MFILEGIYSLTLIGMAVCMVWRIACFFRIKKTCKFTACPFRRRYFDTFGFDMLDFNGCDKCPPTEKEIEDYNRDIAEAMELLERYKEERILEERILSEREGTGEPTEKEALSGKTT